MDAYDRCTNLGKKILPILLPSMVKAENFPDHPRTLGLALVLVPSLAAKTEMVRFPDYLRYGTLL